MDVLTDVEQPTSYSLETDHSMHAQWNVELKRCLHVPTLCAHICLCLPLFFCLNVCARERWKTETTRVRKCVCVCVWVRETKTVLGHSCQCSCVASCKLKCLHGLMETLRGDKDGKVPEIFNWLFAPMTFISLCSSFSFLCLNPMWRKNLGFAKPTSKEKNIKMCEYVFLQADI